MTNPLFVAENELLKPGQKEYSNSTSQNSDFDSCELFATIPELKDLYNLNTVFGYQWRLQHLTDITKQTKHLGLLCKECPYDDCFSLPYSTEILSPHDLESTLTTNNIKIKPKKHKQVKTINVYCSKDKGIVLCRLCKRCIHCGPTKECECNFNVLNDNFQKKKYERGIKRFFRRLCVGYGLVTYVYKVVTDKVSIWITLLVLTILTSLNDDFKLFSFENPEAFVEGLNQLGKNFSVLVIIVCIFYFIKLFEKLFDKKFNSYGNELRRRKRLRYDYLESKVLEVDPHSETNGVFYDSDEELDLTMKDPDCAFINNHLPEDADFTRRNCRRIHYFLNPKNHKKSNEEPKIKKFN